MNKIKISGFSDEIASDFTTQLKTVKELGMNYISLRAIDVTILVNLLSIRFKTKSSQNWNNGT